MSKRLKKNDHAYANVRATSIPGGYHQNPMIAIPSSTREDGTYASVMPQGSGYDPSVLQSANRPTGKDGGSEYELLGYYGTPGESEPVVQSLNANNFITVNRMNCHVLNSLNLGIIDVDVSRRGRGVRSGVYPTIDEAIQLLELSARVTGYTFQIYRTRGGLRYLCTSHPLKMEDKTFALMESVKADPRYIELCRETNSFRARVSPKPLGVQMAPQAAVCQYIGWVGNGPTHVLLARAVKYHDTATKAQSDSTILV